MTDKSCAYCKFSGNVRIEKRIDGKAEWYCFVTPFNHNDLSGTNTDFNTFYCSNWEDVFKKENQ